MDFSVQNNADREFYKKDFSVIKELLDRIRAALVSDTELTVSDLNTEGIIDFKKGLTFIYVTLFQPGLKPLRWGSGRSDLQTALRSITSKLKNLPDFPSFELGNGEKCRIMLEYVIEETPVKIEDIKTGRFVPERFEPGVTGFKLKYNDALIFYMPSDSWVKSVMDLKPALNLLIKKTPISGQTKKISQRIKLLAQSDYECFLIKSRCFITYGDDVLPLYRGNPLYEYSPEAVRDVALAGADWAVRWQNDDGKFLYYYDAKDDNFRDHEHPTRTEDNLYYNDLRHCGGVVTLIRAYQLTKDSKYLDAAKKAIDFTKSLTVEHDYNGKPAGFIYYNEKGKLGGTGLALVEMMKYRVETGDKSYDEYIKKYARHIISRIHETGEMLGYYIHPGFQNGNPLIDMTSEERRATFSFYYPGEALLGLALFADYFEDDAELVNEVIEKSEFALDWLVNERPKIYADLFTDLPSDAWLMQAIEEWATNPRFRKESYLDFVFKDAAKLMQNMYKKDDSPYIDYEGAYYYNNGDHYYPDGSRSEGLIAAYYLAKKMNYNVLAGEILKAARLTAKSQMILVNNKYNSYAFKNPEKAVGAIRFKATRQWVRIDSVQHVACFFFRLYFAEIGLDAK